MNTNINIHDLLSKTYFKDLKKAVDRGIASRSEAIKAEAKAEAKVELLNENALKLLQKGFTSKQVADLLDMNLSEVESLKSSHSYIGK